MSRLLALLVALVVLVATGCGTQKPAVPATTSDPELLAARKAAGIPDCPHAPSTTPVAREGAKLPLPDLVLDCLGTGSTVSLAGLPKGKPWVINFWAQWCGPCREEAPFLLGAWKTHGDRVGFLGVDTNDPDPHGAIAFAQGAGWPWPHLQDPDFRVRSALKVPGLPHTLFVDAEGRIAYQVSGGFSSQAEIETIIRERLLAA